MSSEKKGMFLSYAAIIKGSLLLIAVVLFVIIIMQNIGSIPIRLLSFEFSVPTIVVILGSLGIGVIIGSVLTRYRRRKKG